MQNRIWAAVGVVLLAVSVISATPPAESRQGQLPTAPAASGVQDYVFPTSAGVLFFYVKPDHTADFEAVVTRLSVALDNAPDGLLKQQAAGWHMLRSVETVNNAAVYVFMFDPAVASANYDPIKVIAAVLPAEQATLYTKLKDSVIRIERMGLVRLR
jgi:hypothetical protein